MCPPEHGANPLKAWLFETNKRTWVPAIWNPQMKDQRLKVENPQRKVQHVKVELILNRDRTHDLQFWYHGKANSDTTVLTSLNL